MKTEELVNLYRIEVYQIEPNTDEVEWAAEVPDLPGCVAGGATAEEALEMARDAIKSWIEVAKERGKKIPEPTKKHDATVYFSGKLTVRLPKSLHRELSHSARGENMSLNQYIVFLLTKSHYTKKFTQETTLQYQYPINDSDL